MSRDKYMKIFYSCAVLITSLLLSSCTAELTTSDISDDSPSLPSIEVEDNAVYAVLPQLDNVDLQSRVLKYDNAGKNMKFTWEAADAKIGVYSNVEDHYQLQVMEMAANQGVNSMIAQFVIKSQASNQPDVRTLTENTTYYACHPLLKSDEIDPAAIPFDLSHQSNPENAKYKRLKDSTSDPYYVASEYAAAAHLTDLDLLLTNATGTTGLGGCTFVMQRQFAVARFYMKCPAAEVFDSLLFVIDNPQKFNVDGTVNMFTQEMTPNHQRNVISLKYGDSGLDMTDKSSDYYYNNVGYMISYMMLPPIDLRDAKHLYVYLCSHEKEGEHTKHYWEADIVTTATNKVNLLKNGYKQFTSGSNKEAIEFKINPISVEQWEVLQEGWLNENGSGTEGW